MFYDDLTGADGQPPNPQEMAQRRQANQAAADPGLWERAEAHNPDPARFCPVQVTPPLRLSLTPTPTLRRSPSLSLTRSWHKNHQLPRLTVSCGTLGLRVRVRVRVMVRVRVRVRVRVS